MRHIIAASDLSDRGDRALHRALLLARETGARLTVLTVIDDALPPALAKTMSAAAQDELQRIVASFDAARVPDVEITVLTGDPAQTVAEHAMTQGADLLVLGRHRERPFADLFQQTTVERIVALARCPALLVTSPASAPYRNLLVAVDFSPAAAAAVDAALKVAPDATRTGLHVYHVPYRGLMPGDAVSAFLHEAEHAEASWRAQFSIPAERLPVQLTEGGIRSGLAQVIAETRPDLVALGAHGRSVLSVAVLGGVARMLMREPPCDLLIACPATARAG